MEEIFPVSPNLIESLTRNGSKNCSMSEDECRVGKYVTRGRMIIMCVDTGWELLLICHFLSSYSRCIGCGGTKNGRPFPPKKSPFAAKRRVHSTTTTIVSPIFEKTSAQKSFFLSTQSMSWRTHLKQNKKREQFLVPLAYFMLLHLSPSKNGRMEFH